jgi:hypothetical protein
MANQSICIRIERSAEIFEKHSGIDILETFSLCLGGEGLKGVVISLFSLVCIRKQGVRT